MKFLKFGLSALAVAGICWATCPVEAGYSCPEKIFSFYEDTFPDQFLMEESVVTAVRQESLLQDEKKYTRALAKRKNGHLRPVPGVKKKHNEIIVQMQEAAGNGANIISNSKLSIDGIDNLGDYSSAKSQIDEKLVVRPYSERNGKTYTTAELNEIFEKQRTAINDFAANAIGMGAAETVNAMGDAVESNPEDRAKEIAKAKTLAELFELMIGMDRRIYERSLHASAVEATNAGVEALQALAGVSMVNSGQ